MKSQVFLFLLIFPFISFGQQTTFEQWEKESRTNKRLLPKYGLLKKSKKEKKADELFIKEVLEIDKTYEKGSAHMIDLGFKYLYKELKTAMYRFNQAYLLDSTNSDIYWGFGAVYFMLNQLELARDQYKKGLERDPNNTRIITDLGTTYMSEYFATKNKEYLEKAIEYLSDSFDKDPNNQNTSYKLSTCFLLQNDCENALKYYDICMNLGGDPVTKQFKTDIENRCN